MYDEIKDPEFAKAVDEIADSIEWPDTSFTLSPWDAVMGLVSAFFEATTTPNRVVLRYALSGLAL